MLYNREDLRIYLDDDFVAIVNIYKKQKHMKAESGFTCNNRTPCSLYNNINVFTLYNAPKIPSYQIVTKRVTYTYTIYLLYNGITRCSNTITFSPLLYIWLTYWYLTYRYKNTVQIQTTICIAVCWPKQWRFSSFSFIFGAESTWQPVRPLLTRNFAFK